MGALAYVPWATGNGNPLTCDIVQITTGLSNVSEALKVYPTLTTGLITVEHPSLNSSPLRVVNVFGQLVAKYDAKAQDLAVLDISHLPNGTYFIMTDKAFAKAIKQ